MGRQWFCLLWAIGGPSLGLCDAMPARAPSNPAVIGRRSAQMDEMKAGAVLLDVLRLVVDEYVDTLKPSQVLELTKGAIDGMLKSLDSHSGVAESAMLDEMDGNIGGIGVQVLPLKNPDYPSKSELTIVSVPPGKPKTPAEHADLKPGDVILKIDDKILGRHDQAIEKIRGKVGTSVTLDIKRKVGNKFTVIRKTLTRALFRINPVKSYVEPETHVGYVRINIFDKKTVLAVKQALENLYKAQPKLNCILLDLRNNYGGFLDQAIATASLFIPSGTIVSVKGRQQTKAYKALPEYFLVGPKGKYDAAVLVLVNGYSASASEILAGAFKDHQRGIIVGQPTFGKGSVQEVREVTLDPENRFSFKFTRERFYTPKDHAIQGVGVMPDIIITENVPSNQAAGEKEAFNVKERDLPNALQAEPLQPKRLQNEKPGSRSSCLHPSLLSCTIRGKVIAQNSVEAGEIVLPESKEEEDSVLKQAMKLSEAVSKQFELLNQASASSKPRKR